MKKLERIRFPGTRMIHGQYLSYINTNAHGMGIELDEEHGIATIEWRGVKERCDVAGAVWAEAKVERADVAGAVWVDPETTATPLPSGAGADAASQPKRRRGRPRKAKSDE